MGGVVRNVDLHVQMYLRCDDKDLHTLEEEYGIKHHSHPSQPIVGLSYSQTDSPKTDPIVRECRGLCLEVGSWDVVARPFMRFFNLGEALEITQQFDWSSFRAYEKHDGTLVILYFYNGWRIKTRGSFANGSMMYPLPSGDKITYLEMFRSLMPNDEEFEFLDKSVTYCFEMCSLQNKIVRTYSEPSLYLLAAFHTQSGQEVPFDALLPIAGCLGVGVPESYDVSDERSVQELLRREENRDAGREGFVLRDCNGLRLKVKTDTYRSLHNMHNNGHLLTPKGIFPLVLRNRRDLVEERFPEALPMYDAVERRANRAWEGLKLLWMRHAWEPDQKRFALAVRHNPFRHVLFSVRKKRGDLQSLSDLREEWLSYEEYIAKVLF